MVLLIFWELLKHFYYSWVIVTFMPNELYYHFKSFKRQNHFNSAASAVLKRSIPFHMRASQTCTWVTWDLVHFPLFWNILTKAKWWLTQKYCNNFFFLTICVTRLDNLSGSFQLRFVIQLQVVISSFSPHVCFQGLN